MFCIWCGKQVDDDTKFCPNCGKEILKDEKEVSDEKVSSTTEEEITTQNSANQVVEPVKEEKASDNQNTETVNETKSSDNSSTSEKVDIGFAILSFFIPLAGLIIFFVKKDKEPKTAKASGICAIVGFLLGIIISFIITFLVISGGLKMSEKMIDKSLNTFDKVIEKSDDVTDYNEENKDIDVSNDSDVYEFIVNGYEIELPCSYDDLKKATGFSMKSSDENSVLSNNYYTIVNMYKNDKLALYTEILNDTGGDAKYTEGKITRVSQSKYQVSNGADKIVFPGGLTAGEEITIDKIKELFGEPTDTNEYSSDGYESLTYTYNADTSWTTTNYFEIKVVNGVIDEITLDNRNYK